MTGNGSKLGIQSSAQKDPITKLAMAESNHRSGSMMGIKSNHDLLNDVDRPKNKAELQEQRKQEKERLRVQRAADRREHWVNMVANDPDFLLGYQQGSLPLFHTENFKFRDFSLPGNSGLMGSVMKTSLEKNPLKQLIQHQPTDYDVKQPNAHPVFRERGTMKDMTSPITKYKHKDQRERIQDQILGTVPFSTEPINTLLLSRPKWREHDEAKWVGGKEFISQNSKKDQGWQPLSNVRQEFPEPFMEAKVQFRDTSSKFHTPNTMSGLISSAQKKRNLSQVKTQVNQVKSQSIFRAGSPGRSSDEEDAIKNSLYDGESPVNARNFQMQPFDSTIPQDKTWGNRIGQSTSLRQAHHLNQSLKLRKNLLQNNDSHKIIDMRTQIMVSQNESASPIVVSSLQIAEQQKTSQPNVIIEENPMNSSPERNITSGAPSNIPQSPMTQINSISPQKFQATFSQTKTVQKPPLPKKEQIIHLENMAPDVAASYLNNDLHVSYPNTWQYQVVAKAPATYFNKKFEEKEELRETHVLWEMDKEKTYYKSAMEKIQGKKLRQEVENEKLRRTYMGNSLNSNIMERTVDPMHYTKGSGSFNKLPASASKKNSHRKMNSQNGFETPMDVYDKTNISPYIALNSGVSPSKTAMNMTMPKGFMSPKNSNKKGTISDSKKQDVKDVVKSYFDKSGGSPISPNLRLAPPTTASGLSNFKVLEIEAITFNSSPQK